MFSDLKERLNSELKQWDSWIREISFESKQFTTPNGEVILGLPNFVRIMVESSCGNVSYIKHEIWLPEDWNGCFIGTGNGGMAGVIVYSTLAEYVKMGAYAVANTDMGTSDGEARGVNNPDVYCDFGWRATYIMTVVGKLIVRAYYKKEIRYSYFIGRSTGGQQALSLAQRYPNEYDGIIAGVPGNNRTNLHTYFLWTFSALKKSGVVFSKEELDRINQSAILFSKQNGLSDPEDQFVSNPRADAEHIGRFITYLSKNNSELSAEKLSLLKEIYLGPMNPRTGRRIFCGLPIGSAFNQCGGIWDLQQRSKCPPYFYPFKWIFGADYDWKDFDFDKDLDTLNNGLSSNLNANKADLSPFLKKGGKLFVYSGSADPCVPFPDTMKYYDRVIGAIDAEAYSRDGIRYFLIPGQGHDASITKYGSALMNENIVVETNLDIIRTWRERGIAPNRFQIVTSDSQSEMKRKTIYAYGTNENPSIEYPVCDEIYLDGTVEKV